MKMTPLERFKAIQRGELNLDGTPVISPVQTVSGSSVDASSRYRRPLEGCIHPADMTASMEGRTVGMLRVCTACGRILNDPDEV